MRLRVSALLAAVLLAGCGVPTHLPPTGEPLRPASSARVTFVVPASLPVQVQRWGQGAAPSITKQDQAQARDRARVLVQEVRKQVPAAIETMLRSRGVPAGDEAHVQVQVDSVVDEGSRELIDLTVSVRYRSDPVGTAPWAVKITGSTYQKIDAEVAAGRVAERAVELLVQNGLVASGRR